MLMAVVLPTTDSGMRMGAYMRRSGSIKRVDGNTFLGG
jgi:hypothetical protein